MVYTLLKFGANPNLQNNTFGRTPLHYAVDYKNLTSVELML
jgi:ankyrin repeat protein